MKTALKFSLFFMVFLISSRNAESLGQVPVFTKNAASPLIEDCRIYNVKEVKKFGANEYRALIVKSNNACDYPDDFNADLLTSTDGITWKEGKSGVISSSITGRTFNYDVTELKEDNLYKAWHAATDNWCISFDDIMYSESYDGINFNLKNIAFGITEEYENRKIGHPHIVKGNGKYYIYYRPSTGSACSGYSYSGIAVATSQNGATEWTKQGIVLGSEFLGNIKVVYDSSGFEAFTTKKSGDDYLPVYLKSTDGINWDEIGLIESLPNNIGISGVVKEGGEYKLWYTQNDDGYKTFNLATATAVQVVSPTPPDPRPVPNPTSEPTGRTLDSPPVWVRTLLSPQYYFEGFDKTTGWNNFTSIYTDWQDESQHGLSYDENDNIISNPWNDPAESDKSGYQVQSVSGETFLRFRTESGTYDRPKLMTKEKFALGSYEWRVFIPNNMMEDGKGANTSISAWLYDHYDEIKKEGREIDFEIGWGEKAQREKLKLKPTDNKVLLHMQVQPTDGIIKDRPDPPQDNKQFRYHYEAIDAGYWYTFKIVLLMNEKGNYLVQWFYKKDNEHYQQEPVHWFDCPYGPASTKFRIACSLENFPEKWLGENVPPIEPHHAKFDFVRHIGK